MAEALRSYDVRGGLLWVVIVVQAACYVEMQVPPSVVVVEDDEQDVLAAAHLLRAVRGRLDRGTRNRKINI